MFGGEQRGSGPAVWGNLVLAAQEDIHNQWVDHGLDSKKDLIVNHESDFMDEHRVSQRPDSRLFLCSYCTYRATQKGNLQRHIRTHTGDSPFACPHCSYRTKDQSNLLRHIRRKHR
ncbi:hypothetical protein OTU49_012352 [Cherax quadricarinatus]|uniref:C2H2-type domain-containing protein n=1 Tax=Cherax quadricarinatus TaxID=27406 RepID=A0AAW0Y5N8_CHEQU